jgi:hypothetical protein
MVRIKKRARKPQKKGTLSKKVFKKVGYCSLPSCRKRFFVKREGEGEIDGQKVLAIVV